MKPLFELGQVVATLAAIELLEELGFAPSDLLNRHIAGDWGDVCDEDKLANEDAIREGARILSAYTLQGEEEVWVITEADRASTCILLPSEY